MGWDELGGFWWVGVIGVGTMKQAGWLGVRNMWLYFSGGLVEVMLCFGLFGGWGFLEV